MGSFDGGGRHEGSERGEGAEPDARHGTEVAGEGDQDGGVRRRGQDGARHGRAVNLDPAALILDMLVRIDQTAGELAAL